MATTPSSPATPGWGIEKSISGYETCIITDWECATEFQVAYCQDQKGAVVHRECYDTKTTINATVLAPTSAKAPDKDTAISIDNNSFGVLSVREIESNKDFRKLSFSLEKYTNWDGPSGSSSES